MSDNSNVSTQNRQFTTASANAPSHRHQPHIDDADLLTWKRQYANNSLRNNSTLSNSVEDLTQLIDPVPYQFETSGQDFNEADDDELHFDNGMNYDYDVSIQERLKRANAEFEHDETPAELKHRQRVSFDAVVKAVDIKRDAEENSNPGSSVVPPVSPITEEVPTTTTGSQNESNPHEYTVPLNDTQPKEGPTLLQQIKAMQFHGGPPVGDRRPTATATNNDSSSREDNLLPSKANTDDKHDTHKSSETTRKSSPLPQNSMVVAINGGFELQNEDDYTAKNQPNSNDNRKSSTKVTYTPTPPTEPKQRQDPVKHEASQRSYMSTIRPKSSESERQVNNKSNNTTSRSLTDNRNQSNTNRSQRSKSACVSKSLESFINKPARVDFDELNRKAAEKKRAEQRKERRDKEEAEEKRKIESAKAQESFEKWVQDKDSERRKLNEEKRMEREDEETRQTQCEKELAELREKKYKEWIERKNQDVIMANEFKKLQAEEEEMASGGSSSSLHSSNRRCNNQAFNRWLRQKYEQSREEKRQLRLETRRLRRHQRRSIKRYQLQQDLQLAKSFGYT